MHYSDFQDWNQNVKVVGICCNDIVEVVEVCWNQNVEAVEICCNLEDCESSRDLLKSESKTKTVTVVGICWNQKVKLKL